MYTLRSGDEEVTGVTQSEHDFFDWLACSVVLADDFETNPGFYREIICRKLVHLGMLKLEDDRYVLPDPTAWRGETIREPDCRICAQSSCRHYHETRRSDERASYVRYEIPGGERDA